MQLFTAQYFPKEQQVTAVDPGSFEWRDTHGQPLQDKLNLELVAPVKRGVSQAARAGFRVRCGSSWMLLKVRFPGTLKMRLQRALGQGGLYNEFAMLQKAARLGFRVPEPVAIVPPGLRNLCAQHALLLHWLPDHLRLRAWVVGVIRRHQSDQLDALENQIARLFGRIRQAGLSDSDFGAHNLMYTGTHPSDTNLVWIDLESAFHATAVDPHATVTMANSLLSNWWVITEGQQSRLQSLLDAVRKTTPEPTGGWRSVEGLLNDRLRRSIGARVRKGHSAVMPGPLRLR